MTDKTKLIQSAQKLVQKGQTDKAIKEYLRVVEVDPKDAYTWHKIGELEASRKGKVQAIDAYLRAAELYVEQGFSKKAEADFKLVLQLEPMRLDVNEKLGLLYKQMGLLRDAKQQLEIVANQHQQNGQVQKSLEVMEQIVDLDPSNVASRVKLAELYSKEGMKEQAIDEFTRAANALRAQNRTDDYVKVAERLIWHQPENLKLAKDLANLYLRKGDPKRAFAKLQSCYKADPRDVDTIKLLAEYFEHVNQLPNALKVYKELANLLAEKGKQDERLAVYKKVLSIAPDDADARQAVSAAEGSRARVAVPLETEDEEIDEADALGVEELGDEDLDVEEIEGDVGPGSGLIGRPSTGALPVSVGSRVAAVPAPTSPPRPEPPRDSPRPDPSRMEQAVARGTSVVGTSSLPPPGSRVESSGREEASDVIARIILEAEVFVKFGLHDKAVDHLKKVFDHDPTNVEARDKLKDLYVQIGNTSGAVNELMVLARQLRESQPSSAAFYASEAQKLDPQNAEARKLAESLGRPAPSPKLAAADSDLAPPMSEDEADEIFASSMEPAAGDLSHHADGRGPYDRSPEDSDSGIVADSLVFEESSSDAREIDPDLLESLREEDAIPLVSRRGAPATVPESPGPIRASQSPRVATPLDDDGEPELLEEELEQREMQTDRGSRRGSGVLELEAVGNEGSDVIQLPLRQGRAPSDERGVIDESDDVVIPRLGPGASLEEALEEAEFFVHQGLTDEARSVLEELSQAYPDNALVASRLSDLDALLASDSGAASTSRGETEIVRDAPERTEQHDLPEESYSRPPTREDTGHRNVLLEKELGEEDAETHFNLGIAYKEMGLYDDAVSEFKVAMKAPERRVLCLMMIGLCYGSRGSWDEAISNFKKALYVDGVSDHEQLALYFELGLAYEALADGSEALYYYEKVQRRDARFRDVARRIAALSQAGNTSKAGTGTAAAAPVEDVDRALDELIGSNKPKKGGRGGNDDSGSPAPAPLPRA